MSVEPQKDFVAYEADAPEEEAPMGAPQRVHTSLNLPHILYVTTVNVLVLAELCVAMYMAAQEPDAFTPVFFKVFFSLLAPTLILAIVAKRFLPKAKP